MKGSIKNTIMLTAALALMAGGAAVFAQGTDANDAARAMNFTKAWELEGFNAPESVIYDAKTDSFYVTNVAGSPGEKDGVGFISKVKPNGEMDTREWFTRGLNAPKGTAIVGRQLYVADIDKLAKIDIDSGGVYFYDAPDAKFLNDVTADSRGDVYVSDMMGNAIWKLNYNLFTKWLETPDLMSPNGLKAEKGRIVVASWGIITSGFDTSRAGNLKTVSLADKTVANLGDGKPVGALDGLEPDGMGNYLVTDFMAGALYRIMPSGDFQVLLDLDPGSADLTIVPEKRMIVIPIMNDNKIVAYTY